METTLPPVKSELKSTYVNLRESFSHEDSLEFLALRYPDSREWLSTDFSAYLQLDQDVAHMDKPDKPQTPAKQRAQKLPKIIPLTKQTSKYSKAVDIFMNADQKDFKALLPKFKELGLSPAASSTYYYKIKGSLMTSVGEISILTPPQTVRKGSE